MKICPSMLACDFSRIGDECHDMKNSGADMLHLDVMDGLFVPNISFGMPVIKAIRDCTDLFLDVHLMIDDAQKYIDAFCQAGADSITIHAESNCNIKKTLEYISSKGKKAALSIKPATSADVVFEFMPLLDMVLIMTVEPGFGGQSFMDNQLPKITEMRKKIDTVKPGVLLQVDGGIDEKTVALAARAGADCFVAGSSIFKSSDRAATIDRLRQNARDNYVQN